MCASRSRISCAARAAELGRERTEAARRRRREPRFRPLEQRAPRGVRVVRGARGLDFAQRFALVRFALRGIAARAPRVRARAPPRARDERHQSSAVTSQPSASTALTAGHTRLAGAAAGAAVVATSGCGAGWRDLAARRDAQRALRQRRHLPALRRHVEPRQLDLRQRDVAGRLRDDGHADAPRRLEALRRDLARELRLVRVLADARLLRERELRQLRLEQAVRLDRHLARARDADRRARSTRRSTSR